MHALVARTEPAARGATALLGALVLGACVGNVFRPVAESARDTEGRYDGLWVAKVDAPGGRQTVERWYFDCRPVAFEWTFEVRDGVARIDLSDDEGTVRHEAFVDADGRFRLEMPQEESVRASAGSDQPISDGAVTLILEGELGGDDPRGYYVAGVRQFLDRGCRHRVDYHRRDARGALRPVRTRMTAPRRERRRRARAIVARRPTSLAERVRPGAARGSRASGRRRR